MTTLRMTRSIVWLALTLFISVNSALARPTGGFFGSHGTGFSGGHGQFSSGGHWSGHDGGNSWGYRGGYGRAYGRGYYNGFYDGIYIAPWALGSPWGYAMTYQPVVGYAAYPYDVTPSFDGAYIQQAPVAPQISQPVNQPNDWYYCQDPAGYYPYIKACSAQWQRVPAIPPN